MMKQQAFYLPVSWTFNSLGTRTIGLVLRYMTYGPLSPGHVRHMTFLPETGITR